MRFGVGAMIAAQNESTPGALKQLLLSRRPHICADLWRFELVTGQTYHWTSADVDLTVAGQEYLSQICITRDRCRLTTGVETSTQTVTLSPRSSDGSEPAIAGIPMRQALRAGLFDGAKARLTWAYYQPGQDMTLIGTLLRFTGNVGDIDAFGAKAILTVNSPLKRLDMQIPWKAYGAGCRYILGDSDCGADPSALAVSGAVSTGSSNGTVNTDLTAADGDFAGAVITVTTSDGAVFRRTIRDNVGGVMRLKTPMPWAPAAGDSVVVTPGCNKTAPTAGAAQITATIPAGLTVALATTDSFAEDMGVTMTGLTHVVAGYWSPNEWDENRQWVPASSYKDADTTMTKVGSSPTTGQYTVTGNVYGFAAADLGREITAKATTLTGGAGGCRRFHGQNALSRFGGMPFIPAPETAY